MMKKKCSTAKIVFIVAFIYLLIIGLITGYKYYTTSNVIKTAYIYIPTGASFDDVVQIMQKEHVLKDKKAFIASSKLYRYNTVRSGKYLVRKGMRNRQLIRMLASGQQSPVKLTIAGNIRDIDKIASILSKQIEADSTSLVNVLSDTHIVNQLGFTPDNILSLFIPNTYEVYWNLDSLEVLNRMKREYDRFWNDRRTKKLDSIGLTREQVIVIASIVNEETNKTDEMQRIAGVYINRVNRGMRLDADPTVKFANGDFSIKRVLDRHKEVKSPYNTYMYAGLPPGPICIPSIASIDAVLSYEKHDYLYFCAKDDFSGYHVFARTLSQHNQNADAYHRALNRNKIY